MRTPFPQKCPLTAPAGVRWAYDLESAQRFTFRTYGLEEVGT